jgi:antitoxin CcdA
MKHQSPTTVMVTTSITCDRCKTTHDDSMEMQEFLSWSDTCGYGNKTFGDMSFVSIDLCQYCVKEVLGEWIQCFDHPAFDQMMENISAKNLQKE